MSEPTYGMTNAVRASTTDAVRASTTGTGTSPLPAPGEQVTTPSRVS
jgi:hypothetical protein